MTQAVRTAPTRVSCAGPASRYPSDARAYTKADSARVEALEAATAAPARCFELADRGRIPAGMRADLVLVHGDPTTTIDDVRDVAAVWKNGYQVPRL